MQPAASNDNSAPPARNCHMGRSQRSTVVLGPLGPDQSRGNLGKSRLWCLGSWRHSWLLSRSLLPPWQVPCAFTKSSPWQCELPGAAGGQVSARHGDCLGVTPAAEQETLVPPAEAWQGLGVPGGGIHLLLGVSVQSVGEGSLHAKKTN